MRKYVSKPFAIRAVRAGLRSSLGTVHPASEPCRRPLRVALLDHTAELGGAELALARVLDVVEPSQVEPVVVLFSSGPLEHRLLGSGHEVVIVPLASGLLRTPRSMSRTSAMRTALLSTFFVPRLVARLRRLDVDVVHTTSLKADLLGGAAARLLRRPLVWHVHDRISKDYLPAWVARSFRVLARRMPSAVVANSAATAATLPGARRLTVVHPGVSVDQVAPAPRSQQPEGGPVVGMVGRLSPTKGQHVLVRAARRVVDVRPDVRFRLIGSPAFGAEAYDDALREEVHLLGLADHITFVGFVDDTREELTRMTMCVHASTVPEPFGQVVTEAMAWGVPVVATRGGGVDDIVCGGESASPTALLVDPDDDAALAGAILEVLMEPERALARAALAHADVARRFSVTRGAQDLVSVWRASA